MTHLAWVEADLSYPDDTMEALLAHDKPIIAPWIYLNSVFYDSWGFRDKNGSRITSIEPYFPNAPHEPIELSSVGSYVLFDTAIFRSNIRFRADYDHGLLIGICQEAAKIGFNLCRSRGQHFAPRLRVEEAALVLQKAASVRKRRPQV